MGWNGNPGTEIQTGDDTNNYIQGKTKTSSYFRAATLKNQNYTWHREDQIWGNGGADTLVGRGENDTLYGGNDNDVLYGGDESTNPNSDNGYNFQ
ncbi:MAG: hypothetical protein AAFO04_30295, partial [Cyanobacteria bacterium J06592_8]